MVKEGRIGASSEYGTLYRSFLLRYRSNDFDIGRGKEGRIRASSRYRTLYRRFLLRYRCHDFDIEVYEYPLSWNLRKLTLISKSKLRFWYWINPSCWGPWLKWAQLGGDSKGPSASANLRLGLASSVNSATLVRPAHSYRTILVLKHLFYWFKSSFAASSAETSRNAWCNKVSILTRLYAVIHYLMLICNILLCSPCFWITLSVISTTRQHRSFISCSVIICIWNQQDDVRIISKLG